MSLFFVFICNEIVKIEFFLKENSVHEKIKSRLFDFMSVTFIHCITISIKIELMENVKCKAILRDLVSTILMEN